MSSTSPARNSLSIRQELHRKALHLLTALVPIVYALNVARRYIVYMLATAVVIALAVEAIRFRSDRHARRIHAMIGALLREHERERWVGATWLLLSFLALALFTPRAVCIAAMWSVSVGDAMAAIIGRSVVALDGRSTAIGHWLTRPRGDAGKTIAGSLGCLASVVLGASVLARLSITESIIAAVGATIGEWPAHVVDDNVRIAVAVVAGILLWRFALS